VTLHDWFADNDGTLLRTLPRQDQTHGETYVVEVREPRYFRGPRYVRLEEDQLLVVDNHPASWEYGLMPRWWREHLFPINFRRWTEDEHAARRTVFTWEQQQNVGAHKDAGEAWADGQLTTAQYEQHISYLEPLPSLAEVLALFSIASAKARAHHMQPLPGVKPPPPNEAASRVTAEQLAEVNARVDRLKARYPEATPGQILTMLAQK